MFEYSADLITGAQSDIECGLDTIAELLSKKSSVTSLESYTGKVDVNLIFTSLAFIKHDLEDADSLIINTKENIETVEVGAVNVVDSDLPTKEDIIEMINNLPISDEEKKEALRLLEECSVRAAYAYLCVISCDQEIAACDEILEVLYGEIARPDFNPEKNEYDAFLVETINHYEGVRDSLYEERRMWEDNLELWKFDYLDNVELDMTDVVVDESIAPLISCLYTPDGRPRFDYAEWGVPKFKTLMESQGKDLSDVSMFGLAMYLFTDPEYKKWYESDEGVGEPLTKEGVLEHLGISMINNSSGSLQARAFIYMDDEQVAKYNWVYANKGPEEAQKYLEALENDINLTCATDLVLADIDTLLTGNSSDSAFLRCLELNGISIADGVVMWMDNTATLFNGNTNYTVTEQKQGMLSQLVITGYACAPLTDYDLKMQLENGEITQDQYDVLTSSDKQVTNLDVMLVRGDISQHTYDSYNIVINDPGFQELSSKLGNNERKAMGYVSSAGLATGNMLPSVITSAFITMAGGGAPAATQLGRTIGSVMMWTSAYGSSYKTGIRSGFSDERAAGYAFVSATAETLGEVYLGTIPFIGNGSKIALKSLPLSVIVNGGVNVLKEIGQEEIQGVFVQNIIDSVFFGQPLDLSALPEEAWDIAITTAISTSTLGIVGGPLQMMTDASQNMMQNNSMLFKFPDGFVVEILSSDIKQLSKVGIIFYDNDGNMKINVEAFRDYAQLKSQIKINLTNLRTYNSELGNEIIENVTLINISGKNINPGQIYSAPGMQKFMSDYNLTLNDVKKIVSDGGITLTTYGNLMFDSNIITDEYINELVLSRQRFNAIQEILYNNESILQREILETIPEHLSDEALARKLYIELNKRIHYDASYFDLSEEAKREVLSQTTSFENLKKSYMVCKGWSDLYRELLINAGFSESQVSLKSNSSNAHFWVEIDLGDNNIIIADATDALTYSNDIVNSKTGSKLYGFLKMPDTFSGQRIYSFYIDEIDRVKENVNNYWNDVDGTIGYQIEGQYYSDLLNEASSLFNNKVDHSRRIELLKNVEINSSMDGFEAYVYLKNISYKLLGDSCVRTQNIKINGEFESVAMCEYESDSGNYYMVYSPSLGKIEFDSREKYEALFGKF